MRMEPLRRHLAVWKAAWTTEKLAPRLAPRTAEELAFLPAVIEIVETPASPLGRATAAVIMAMFAIALAWASIGQLDIHATAAGRIIPGGKTKPVAASECHRAGHPCRRRRPLNMSWNKEQISTQLANMLEVII